MSHRATEGRTHTPTPTPCDRDAASSGLTASEVAWTVALALCSSKAWAPGPATAWSTGAPPVQHFNPRDCAALHWLLQSNSLQQTLTVVMETADDGIIARGVILKRVLLAQPHLNAAHALMATVGRIGPQMMGVVQVLHGRWLDSLGVFGDSLEAVRSHLVMLTGSALKQHVKEQLPPMRNRVTFTLATSDCVDALGVFVVDDASAVLREHSKSPGLARVLAPRPSVGIIIGWDGALVGKGSGSDGQKKFWTQVFVSFSSPGQRFNERTIMTMGIASKMDKLPVVKEHLKRVLEKPILKGTASSLMVQSDAGGMVDKLIDFVMFVVDMAAVHDRVTAVHKVCVVVHRRQGDATGEAVLLQRGLAVGSVPQPKRSSPCS